MTARLPFLVSVPHAGLEVPPEVADRTVLDPPDIARDGDEEAGDIYLPLQDHVRSLVTTSVARAFVDVNRPEDDRGPDGVVKTVTVWQEPVYDGALPEDLVQRLIRLYHRPYHDRLTDLADSGVVLGLDCHTMAADAPPIARRPGQPRPDLCLSNADGTCPPRLLQHAADRLEDAFATRVALNDPFQGGYIVRAHARELPWLQLEIKRGTFATVAEKRDRVLAALVQLARELPAA